MQVPHGDFGLLGYQGAVYRLIIATASVQFSCSVVSNSFETPWTAACQASLVIYVEVIYVDFFSSLNGYMAKNQTNFRSLDIPQFQYAARHFK